MGESKFESLTSALTLTSTIGLNKVKLEDASNVLSLSDTAESQFKIKTLGDNINLVDQIDINNIYNLSVTHTLALVSTITRRGTFNIISSNQLVFTHDAYNSVKASSVANQLDLQSTVVVSGQPKSASVTSYLVGNPQAIDIEGELLDIDTTDLDAMDAYIESISLRQSINLRRSITNLSVISYLQLAQQAAPTKSETVESHIHLSHLAEVVLYESVISYLNLQQTIVCDKPSWIEQTIALSQTISLEGVYPLTVTSSLNLNGVCSYAEIDFCNYAPGVGDGTFDYTPPSTVAPTLVKRNTTILTWPYSSPEITLELRNPNFDNVEQFEFRRINRRTRGGQLDLYRDEDWPKIQRLVYSFSALTNEQRSGLLEFLQRSIGQEVGVLDFESRQWRGILLTPSSAISEPVRESYNVSLEFEGELV